MILISPWSKKLRNGKENPKNYPYWLELSLLLKQTGEEVIQVGVTGEPIVVSDLDSFRKDLSLSELEKLVKECRTWISVDSFFQHFCWDLDKPGIVLWGPSDPNIFGHPENINLLKDRKYLVPNQFLTWEQQPYNADAFVEPKEVLKFI